MSWASLSLKNLTNALNKVDDWQGLGIQLDIEYHELQKISKCHSTIEECKRAMLQFWLDSDTKASWKALLSALTEMNLNCVANDIESKYWEPSITQSEDSPPSVPTTSTKHEKFTTTNAHSTSPTEDVVQTRARGVREVQQEIDTLVAMYDSLVAKAGVYLSKQQALSPHFLIEFRISVAVLPTSLKYQHSYFLEHHSSQIARATTVEEIFSIVNRYCNFLNCSLLAHIISKFGDEELKKQLNTYTAALQTFRSQTKIKDFMKTCTENPNHPPGFVDLRTKLSPEWEQCTLEDAEDYRKYMTRNSYLADYVLSLVKGIPGSIHLSWSVPSNATDFIVATMSPEFLQHHGIEGVTIDGEDLEEYKYLRVIDPDILHEVISQHVDELSEGLVWASQEGCLEDVVFLLRAGVKVNSRNQEGKTALIEASRCGCLDVVKELLRAKADLDVQDETDWTALMYASGNGHADAVQLLLSSGAQVDLQTESGWTALMSASFNGHSDVVQMLLSSGAQVNLQNKDGNTALMRASVSGQYDVVNLLLANGAQLDLQNQESRTAFMQASQCGHTNVVQLLLLSGAQVNQQDKNGRTALSLASTNGKADVVQLLLSNGAQVDLWQKDTTTALMWASFAGHVDVVQLLVSGGAQVNLQAGGSMSALMVATFDGHADVVQVLLSNGAQVDLQNHHGTTALIYSVQNCHPETVKVLLAAGADVNLKEKTSGRSAVFYGAEKGDLEIVKLLILGGANLSLKDKDGVTADEVAEVHGHHTVCEELRKHMHGDHRPLSKVVRDHVLATGQLLRAYFMERIFRTQKKELAKRTQDLHPNIALPSTPSKFSKGV